MGKWIVGAVAAVTLAVGAYYFVPGFAARYLVAKDKLVDKIDDTLGSIDVMKKEVELKITACEQSIEKRQKKRISVQVKAERMAREVKDAEQAVTDSRNSLQRLDEWMTSSETPTIAGKTYTTQQVKELAGQVFREHKVRTDKLNDAKKTQARLEQIAASLKEQEDGERRLLANYKNTLEQIKLDMLELNALKEAESVAGEVADTTRASQYADLDKKIKSLSDKVKTELRYEDEKWKSLDVSKDLDSADKIISATKTPEDISVEIKKVLEAK
jgi:hypothetical protein